MKIKYLDSRFIVTIGQFSILSGMPRTSCDYVAQRYGTPHFKSHGCKSDLAFMWHIRTTPQPHHNHIM